MEISDFTVLEFGKIGVRIRKYERTHKKLPNSEPLKPTTQNKLGIVVIITWAILPFFLLSFAWM